MRQIVLHRRATKYLRKMPVERCQQMTVALREVAALDDIASHPGVRPLVNDAQGWYRLRVGVYRALIKTKEGAEMEVLLVDYIGPRGDAYKG